MATPVCPPWFAAQFPLQHLEHGTRPQLRTVTNQHIKLHECRWVCVTNHSGQQIVIPFYVCEVKQPILSVTRLVEQGFQLTLDDNPRVQRTKGFNSTFGEQRWPVLPTQAEITTLPRGTKPQIHSTQQGQIGMIAPATTLAPQGPADSGYAGDYWQFNTQGELVRVHRQYRKTLFTPSRTQCPVPAEQLEDYRRIRSKNGTTKCGKERQHAGSRKAQHCQRHSSTAEEHRTEGYTTSNSVQSTHTTERENDTTNSTGHSSTTHHQRCSWTRTTASCRSTSWRRLLAQRRPILEESTHQGNTQYVTHQSRHMRGQTVSDLHLANRPRYNRRQEDSATQDW